ncbi:synaptotagmin-5 isoform X2 [Athalia rosae]|uniref:synaptotagmin-5 isoform X2 n=1 Tax=Athalia rosae TaxID=37344 RepID=UPI0020339C8C|nr:synaptotagmin-5 isoform X2 [Athalia rosae]
MDIRSVDGVVTLVGLGVACASVGTLLGVVVYTICAKFRIVLGGSAVWGPLNWFEEDILDREEAARSRQLLVGGRSDPNKDANSDSDESVWPGALATKENLGASLSETEGALAIPTSPSRVGHFPAPLPESVRLVATENLIVLTKPCRTIPSMQTRLDPAKIDTTLYRTPDDRDPAAPASDEDARGELLTSLVYDAPAGILTVRLIEARNLQGRELSGTADPYAKIRLLPDRSNVWQTRIHKRTLNPVFDEDFVFEVKPATALWKTLEILIYDFDALSRHRSIGCVRLPLSSVDLGSRAIMSKPILRCTERDVRAELGELMVSMSFLPSAERLTVMVIKARNLRVVDDARTSSDPCVKVSVFSDDGKRLKKRKSGVQRNTTNPVWNEALTFDLGRESLSRGSIEFLVLHDSLLGPSEALARCVVSAKSQRDLFNEVLAGRGATAQWLPLAETRQF